MTVLVTGAAGHVGANLVRELRLPSGQLQTLRLGHLPTTIGTLKLSLIILKKEKLLLSNQKNPIKI